MTTFKLLLISFLFSVTLFAQNNLLIENSVGSKVNLSLDTEVYSNFKNASSPNSQRFMFATLGLSHPFLGKLNLFHRLRFDKQLENFRENGIFDYRLSLSGLSKKVHDRLNFIWIPRVDLVFDELRANNFSQKGSLRVTQVSTIKVIPSRLNLNLFTIAAKNFHQFKTNFDGESNSSLIFTLGISPTFNFTEKLSLSVSNFWVIPYSYEGNLRSALSSFDLGLNYQASKKLSLRANLSNTTRILNDLGVTKNIGNYFVSDQALLILGGNYSF